MPQLGGISAEMQQAYAAQAYGQQPQAAAHSTGGYGVAQQVGDVTPMKTGTVKHWFEDKGFGFILQGDGEEDVFVHRSTLEAGQSLVQGAQVQYSLQWTPARNKWTVVKCIGGDVAPAATEPT